MIFFLFIFPCGHVPGCNQITTQTKDNFNYSLPFCIIIGEIKYEQIDHFVSIYIKTEKNTRCSQM